MSRKYASTFAQNAQNMSGYSSTRQEFCTIGLCGAGAAIGPDGPLLPSGKKATWKKRNSEGCCNQARVLGWGKEKIYYYAHKIT